MRKIVMILMTTLISLLITSCAITSGMSKDVKIKEYKLNRLSYVKKICQITDAYESEDFVAYELDNGKGRFVNDKKNKVKVCFIVKNGELYGRYSQTAWHGAVLAQTYHSNKCTSMSSIRGNWKYYYKTDSHTKSSIRAEMNRLAKMWGLI